MEFVVGYDEQLWEFSPTVQQQNTQFSLTLHADTMNDDIDQNELSKPATFIDLLFTYIILFLHQLTHNMTRDCSMFIEL